MYVCMYASTIVFMWISKLLLKEPPCMDCRYNVNFMPPTWRCSPYVTRFLLLLSVDNRSSFFRSFFCCGTRKIAIGISIKSIVRLHVCTKLQIVVQVKLQQAQSNELARQQSNEWISTLLSGVQNAPKCSASVSVLFFSCATVPDEWRQLSDYLATKAAVKCCIYIYLSRFVCIYRCVFLCRYICMCAEACRKTKCLSNEVKH